jgi:hypothetical protein
MKQKLRLPTTADDPTAIMGEEDPVADVETARQEDNDHAGGFVLKKKNQVGFSNGLLFCIWISRCLCMYFFLYCFLYFFLTEMYSHSVYIAGLSFQPVVSHESCQGLQGHDSSTKGPYSET